METDAIIRRQGNSIGLVLPQTVLRETGFTVGQTVSLEATAGSLIIKEKRKRYTAAELNALCDPDAVLPADLQGWDEMPDVGLEVA